jgi:hypothetical protein
MLTYFEITLLQSLVQVSLSSVVNAARINVINRCRTGTERKYDKQTTKQLRDIEYLFQFFTYILKIPSLPNLKMCFWWKEN